MWARASLELEPTDFESLDWLDHAGWPLGHGELAAYYERARSFLQVTVPDISGLDPPSGLALRPRGRSALRVGDGIEASRVAVHLRSTVVRVVVTGDRVERLDVLTADRREVSVRADAYVLAAGGLENTVLMLSSGLGGDLVGRFFADHPFFTVPIDTPHGLGPLHTAVTQLGHRQFADAVVVATGEARRASGLLDAVAFFKRVRRRDLWGHRGVVAWTDLGWALCNGEAPVGSPGVYGRALAGVPALVRAVGDSRRHPDRFAVRVALEPAPNPQSRVTLSDCRDALGLFRARVDWKVGDLERRCLETFLAELAGAAARDGWGPLEYPEGSGWPDRLEGGAHHMGTTRMHESRDLGVVDPHCRVHGVANLFVAGSSVFPTYGYANPTLTIAALAIRLADHLRGIGA